MPCSRTLLPLLLPLLVRLTLPPLFDAEPRGDVRPLAPDMKSEPIPPLDLCVISPAVGTELTRL